MAADLYRVFPNLTAWQASKYPVIEGLNPWKLPSIKCEICSMVWGEISVVYPWVEAPEDNRNLYHANRVCVMTAPDLALAIEPIARVLPRGYPLPPGTSFGQFRGRHASGRLDEDFYLYDTKRLVSRSSYERLSECGALSVGATPTQIRAKSGARIDFVELHLVPRAELAVPKVPGRRFCAACGFDQRLLPERLLIRKATIPQAEELFQLKDDPGVKLAKAGFVDAVKSLALAGIEFEEVDVE
jgi:hypothetical protein